MRSVNKWKPIRVPFWILTSEFCLPVKADFRTKVRNDREDSMMRFLKHENRLAQRRRGKREMRDVRREKTGAHVSRCYYRLVNMDHSTSDFVATWRRCVR